MCGIGPRKKLMRLVNQNVGCKWKNDARKDFQEYGSAIISSDVIPCVFARGE
jgi:hypothetical protein